MKNPSRSLCSWFEDDDDDEIPKSSKATSLFSAHDIISYNEIETISENNGDSHHVNDKGVAHGVMTNVKEEGDSLDLFMMGIKTSAALDTKKARDLQWKNRRHNRGTDKIGFDSEDELWDHDDTTTRKRIRLDACRADEATSPWELDDDKRTEIETEDKSNVLRSNYVSYSSTNREKKRSDQIRPLDKIDNSSIPYESFRRSFLRQNYTSPLKKYCDGDIQVTFIGNFLSKSNQEVNAENNVTTLPIDTFEDLSTRQTDDQQQKQNINFPPALFMALSKAGYKRPTPIQRYAIPLLLSGFDLLCTATTGSGKTLAYALPLVVHVCDQRPIVPSQDGPIGLIISPTRELSLQTTKVIKGLLTQLGGSVISVTGGNRGTYELSKELKLRGCEIVCGTPGRIIDMVRYKNGGIPNLNRVTMVVIDEADKLLSMGFETQVSSILQSIRPDAQRCFVSATFSNRMKRLLADRWASTTYNLYAHLSVGTTGTASEHVAQHVVVLPTAQSKREWLTNHLPSLIFNGNNGSEGKRQINKKNKAIIFVSTRVECEEVSQMLQRHLDDFYGDEIIGSLHGDKHQHYRNETLGSFRKGKISILVATDVAARGLDIEHVNFVINFDPAKNMDSHVHRIGRAGRMVGQAEDDPQGNNGGCHTHAQGVAYTLLTCKDADFAHLLLEAFTRERRHISAELTELAKKSKYHKITPNNLGEKHGAKRSRTS